jgi:hypothetical protein
MTISSTTVKNSYSGNSSTTVFAYTFKIFADSDIQVIIRSSTGTETTKTITTHYTVSGAGDANGGSVTFLTAPVTGETVVLIRNVPQTQAIDYIANDPFPAETHEEGLDRATMTIQQMQEEINRSIKLSKTNTMTSTEFAIAAADRANKVLAFDSTGEISVTQELGTYKGTDTTVTTVAYIVRDIVKSTSAAQLNNVYICVGDSVVGDLLTDTDHFDLLVDAYSAAASEVAAAASAAAAQLSADDAAADLVLTNADVVSTNADVVLTNADVVSTNADAAATAADLVATNQDTIDTAADLVATNQDTIDTAADLVATNQDTIDTAADVVLTHADVLLTNADVVLTHADVVLTNADVVSTGLDKAATNADVLLTAADVISSAASAAAAAASADAFDDVYLGSKTADPTLDNDGDALTEGDLYYNSVGTVLKYYTGSAWVSITSGGITDLVQDTTPQLGGNLDVNGNSIVSVSNGNIAITPNNTGSVVIDGLSHPQADGSAGQFLKTDGSGNLSFDDPAFTLSYTKGTNTGDNSTTAFTINSGRSVNDVLVLVNGFLLTPTTDYTISGTTLTFTTAPASSAEIVFRYLPLNNSGVYTNDTATGDGSTTTLTIDSGRTVEDIIVTVNGVTLVPVTDYTISATTLTFATAPALSAEISVRYLRLT